MNKYKNPLINKIASCVAILKKSDKLRNNDVFDDNSFIETDILNIIESLLDQLDNSTTEQKPKRKRRTKAEMEAAKSDKKQATDNTKPDKKKSDLYKIFGEDEISEQAPINNKTTSTKNKK